MKTFIQTVCWTFLCCGVLRGADTVSLSSLLDEMVDRTAIARFPEPAWTLKQQSSYDRNSKSRDEGWFSNHDWSQYLREEENGGRKEWVIFDAQGPGAVVRWWLFNTPEAGHLRIYLDGNSEPSFTAPIKDMVGGTTLAEPPFSQVLAMGRNLYLPIPYAKSCKITVDQPTMDTLFYYNINYRTYPDGTQVETLTPEILKANGDKLAETGKKLLAPDEETFPAEWEKVGDFPKSLPSGNFHIVLARTGGAIRKLSIKVKADDLPQTLRSTLISLRFDDKQTVFCPLGDFFGSGIGVNPYKSRDATVEKDGTLTVYWVMPFQSSAVLEFQNRGREIDVEFKSVVISPWEWDENRDMYFNAIWRQSRDVFTRPVFDWNFVSLKGKGVYVGDVLSLVNYHSRWWGEGDEKIFVDGETFPSHFGTGTEDYYGYAWSSTEIFEHPFLAQPRSEGPEHEPLEGDLRCYGNNTNLRFRALDAIPFQEDFRFDMEIWHHVFTTVDYAAASMWYGRPGTEMTSDLEEADILFEARQKVYGKTPDVGDRTKKLTKKWRNERRIIDMHQHVEPLKERFARDITIMNDVGVGTVVNLSGGFVTHPDGEISEFQRNKELADQLYPGRYIHYLSLDFARWNEPDWERTAVEQVDEAYKLGAGGLKEYKRLGLFYRDKDGKLIAIDDPKLDPVWRRCGELQMPITIHVADPLAFWKPYDETNERWKELRDHPGWWFGDSDKYPPFQELLDALCRVIEKHPETTFVVAHLGYPENPDWVAEQLDKYPNMRIDLAARIPEIGRLDAKKMHDFFTKYADRILFGTDFMVYDRMILGSSGDDLPPNNETAVDFFGMYWRYFDTNDRQFEHMTPIQGEWRIDAIGLTPDVQRKILFDNARKLLVRSLPVPKTIARKIDPIMGSITLDGKLYEPHWNRARPIYVECDIATGAANPRLSTTVRTLWSDDSLYIAFEAPYTKLTTFEPPIFDGKRVGLWGGDVVEVFVGDDTVDIDKYAEFEVAPTNEKLDLMLDLPHKDFLWNSGWESAVHVDENARRWTTEMRIPLSAIGKEKPVPGTQWKINFYRHDIANKIFMGWSPTASGSAHVPQRYGIIEFQ